MGSYKKIGLSHEMGLIDTPPLSICTNNVLKINKNNHQVLTSLYLHDVMINIFYKAAVLNVDVFLILIRKENAIWLGTFPLV